MKKNRTMRVAVLLMALTLITSCFVGNTFAKYVTSANGSDTARVAKWGIVLTADSELFGAQYGTDNDLVVKSSETDTDVIAPGTKGDAVIFTIAGTPEVDFKFTATLDGVTGV